MQFSVSWSESISGRAKAGTNVAGFNSTHMLNAYTFPEFP